MNKKQNAIKVLGTLIRFKAEKDGLLWTESMLSEMLRITHLDTSEAMSFLKDSGYVAVYRGEYLVTDAGYEFMDEACCNPTIRSANGWKDELLTGLKVKKSHKSGFMVSKKTCIENPALPKAASRDDAVKTPEEVMSEIQHQRAVINRVICALGVTEGEYNKLNDQGRIKYCKGSEGNPHLGIFDFKNKSKKTWMFMCRECMKKRRKK